MKNHNNGEQQEQEEKNLSENNADNPHKNHLQDGAPSEDSKTNSSCQHPVRQLIRHTSSGVSGRLQHRVETVKETVNQVNLKVETVIDKITERPARAAEHIIESRPRVRRAMDWRKRQIYRLSHHSPEQFPAVWCTVNTTMAFVSTGVIASGLAMRKKDRHDIMHILYLYWNLAANALWLIETLLTAANAMVHYWEQRHGHVSIWVARILFLVCVYFIVDSFIMIRDWDVNDQSKWTLIWEYREVFANLLIYAAYGTWNYSQWRKYKDQGGVPKPDLEWRSSAELYRVEELDCNDPFPCQQDDVAAFDVIETGQLPVYTCEYNDVGPNIEQEERR